MYSKSMRATCTVGPPKGPERGMDYKNAVIILDGQSRFRHCRSLAYRKATKPRAVACVAAGRGPLATPDLLHLGYKF